MELERKFLLEEPPADLGGFPSSLIEQGYLIVAGSEELRVRKKGDAYTLTLKKGSGTIRHEVEILLSCEQYGLFRELVTGGVITKRRYEYPLGELTVEVDVYQEDLEGLAVAEVEFPSEESMECFSPPAWLGEEVSEVEAFKNKNLALHGFPEQLARRWKSGERPAWHYRQSGVVPFREKEGGYEVLLVTTRKSGGWTVPKGIVEPGLSPAESAAKEALEEAGVSGEVVEGVSSRYSSDKWEGTCTVTLFPLAVEELHTGWKEDGFRSRRWVMLEEIGSFARNQEMTGAVTRVMEAVAGGGRYTESGNVNG